jgi:hypothetical protein
MTCVSFEKRMKEERMNRGYTELHEVKEERLKEALRVKVYYRHSCKF